MTPSRVRVRRLAVVLATSACLLGTSLPAIAGGKDKKEHPQGRQGPAHADRGDSAPGPPPAAGNPAEPAAPRGQGRARFRAGGGRGNSGRGVGGERGGNGGGAGTQGGGGGSKTKTQDTGGGSGSRGSGGDSGSRRSGGGGPRRSGGGNADSTGTSSPTGGAGSGGGSDASSGGQGSSAAGASPAPQPAAPAPSGQSGGGSGGDQPARRRRSAAGGDRSGSGAPAPRSAPVGTPAPIVAPTTPVITATPAGGAAVSPLGPVGPIALDSGAHVPTVERGAPAGRATGFRSDDRGELPPVSQTVERIVEVVPGPVKAALAALALVALLFAVHSFIAAARARRLARQRGQLLDEVGLLQAALLPSVPARLGDLGSTVAYRPAEGPAAGGDFYDAFAFDGGRVGVIVGDISGHGRDALARTALMRYTLRAYLDAGLEPRAALKVAGSVLDDDLGSDFATVVVAVYDPEAGTLTYAGAGHPPPIVLGPSAHEPVTSYSSPPIGVGATTGLRQTTIGLPAGSVACFFTDGMTEARVDGELLGRERLAGLLAELGPEATAPRLLDRVAELAQRTPDDMAACIIHAHGDVAGIVRVEELEVARQDLAGNTVPRFLRECGIPVADMPPLFRAACDTAREAGTAVLRVRLGDWRPGVDVLPGNVETIAGAVRRRANIAKSS